MLNIEVENLCHLPFGTFGDLSTTCFSAFIFVDWEYGVNLASWDVSRDYKVMQERVRAMQLVNRGTDTICFNWCFYTMINDVCRACQSFSWKNPSKWTMVNTYKNELTAGRDFVMGTDDVLVLEFGKPLKRKADIVPRDVPGSSHNIV